MFASPCCLGLGWLSNPSTFWHVCQTHVVLDLDLAGCQVQVPA